MSTVGRLSNVNLSWTTAIGSGTYFTMTPSTNNTVTLSGSTGSTTVQIKQVSDPTLPQDAATKYYVDSMSQGLSWKQACLAMSSTNVTISSAPFTIDGISPTSLSRILLTGQTNVTENGIYTWVTQASAMTRTADFPNGGNLLQYSGSAVFVQQGTTYADTAWVETFDTGLIGTTTITFAQFSSAGGSAAGNQGNVQFRGAAVGQFAADSNFNYTNGTSPVPSDPTLTIGSATTRGIVTLGNSLTITSTTGTTSFVSTASDAFSMTSSGSGSFTINSTGGAPVSLFPSVSATTIGLGTGQSSGYINIGASPSIIGLKSTVAATSPTAAGVLVSGGLGVADNIYVGTAGLTVGSANNLAISAAGGNTSISNTVGSLTVSNTANNLLLSTITSGQINVDAADQSGTLNGTASGSIFNIQSQTYTKTDNATGFVTAFVFNTIAPSVLSATTATVTETAATLYVDGPTAGTNETFTNSYAIWANGSLKATTVNANLGVYSTINVTSLNVVAPLNFNNLSVTSLTVSGPFVANGSSTLSSTTVSSLSVTNASNFSGQINATSISATNITATSLSITAPVNFTNLTVTTLNVTGPAGFTGTSTFNGRLIATSNSTFNSLSATSAVITSLLSSVINTGGLSVTGTLNGTRAEFTNAINATSAVFGPLNTGALSGTSASFSGAINATSAVLTGALSGTSASFSGAINATSAVLSGHLSGTSASFSDAINATSAVIPMISATSISSSNITVTSLTVTAPVTFSNLNVTTLNVSGPASFSGTSTFSGALVATSNSTFNSLSATSAVIGPLNTGALSGTSATFSDAINATSAVFGPLNTGALSGTSASFSGAINATSAVVGPLNTGALNGTSASFSGAINATSAVFPILSATTILSSSSGLILSTTGGHVMVNAQSQTADAVSSTNGSVFEIFPQTFTNSASLSTITNFVFNSVQQNVFGSTSATTITNIANMYIGAAPIAVNTNANIVNSYALWVDGATKLASLSVTSAATFGPLTSTSATISQLNVTGASNFVGQISATSISASNITVTSLSVTAPLNFTNLSVTTLNVSGPATFTGLSSFAATTISTLSAGLTTFTDTTMATASNAASVVMLGGLAVGKNIWVGTTGLTIGSGTNNNLSIYNDGTGTISNNTGPFLVQNTAASSFTMRNPATQDVFLFDTATTGNINVGTAATTGFVKIWSGTDSSGNTSGALQVVGGAGFGGKVFATEFNATSDVQYKTNIKPIEDPLGLVKKIEGYTYNWKSSFFGYNDKPQMGFIAQQLEEAGLDFMVTTDDNGSKSVNYLKIIAACAEAIKELDAKYEELKKASYKVEF